MSEKRDKRTTPEMTPVDAGGKLPRAMRMGLAFLAGLLAWAFVVGAVLIATHIWR